MAYLISFYVEFYSLEIRFQIATETTPDVTFPVFSENEECIQTTCQIEEGLRNKLLGMKKSGFPSW